MSSSNDIDESLLLPRPSEGQEGSDLDSSESESSDEDAEVSTDLLHNEIQGVYEDWLFSLSQGRQKDDVYDAVWQLCDLIWHEENGCGCRSGASSWC